MRFSRSQFPLWSFQASEDVGSVDNQLSLISFGNGGRKRLSSLFSHVSFRTFSSRSGDRASAPDMVVIFTDGHSNDRPERRISVSKLVFVFKNIFSMNEQFDYIYMILRSGLNFSSKELKLNFFSSKFRGSESFRHIYPSKIIIYFCSNSNTLYASLFGFKLLKSGV